MGEAAEPIYTITPVYRLQLVRERDIEFAPQVTRPSEVRRLLLALTPDDGREHLSVVFLDGQQTVLGCQLVHSGTVGACAGYPKEFVKGALLLNARGIVLAHNHPSAKIAPSLNDDELTLSVFECANAVDVSLHDHVIFSHTHEAVYSYTTENRLNPKHLSRRRA